MKNLIFIFLGFFCFAHSQTDSAQIVQKLKQLEQTNFQTVQLIKKLDKVEAEKLQLIYLINKKIEKLQHQNKLKENKDFTLSAPADTLKALKQDGDVVYWEEIPRKWVGRLLNKENTKIRLFRFENGEKVYVD